MTVTAPRGRRGPERGRKDATLDTQASATVSLWIHDDQAAAGELEEAVRAHTHLRELKEHARQFAEAASVAQRRAANLTSKLDPDGYRNLAFVVGATVVTLLTVLDTGPLNWGAQAFGLDAAATWLVTGILLVASIGAMAGLEMTRGNARKRAALAVVIVGAYAGLAVLRTEFIITITAASPLAAFLQAVLLSAISAGLVLCGSAVMARTRSFRVDRARTAAQRAQHAATTAQKAAYQAADKLHRHLGVMLQMLIPWALRRRAVPAGVDHAIWTAALQRAIRNLFPEL
jgi:hypothetical protein